MAFIKRDAYQPNLIDGSIYLTDVRPNGMYVTVAGNDADDVPAILGFDGEDINALRDAIAMYDGMNS